MKKYTLTLLSFLFIGHSFAQIDTDPLDLHWMTHLSPKKSVYMSKTTLSATDKVYNIGQYQKTHELTTTGAVQTITPNKDTRYAFVQQLDKEGKLIWRKTCSMSTKVEKRGFG